MLTRADWCSSNNIYRICTKGASVGVTTCQRSFSHTPILAAEMQLVHKAWISAVWGMCTCCDHDVQDSTRIDNWGEITNGSFNCIEWGMAPHFQFELTRAQPFGRAPACSCPRSLRRGTYR